MNNAAVQIMKTIWNTAYSFFTGFYIPGTNNVTPLGLLLAATMAIIAVKFIKNSLQGDK